MPPWQLERFIAKDLVKTFLAEKNISFKTFLEFILEVGFGKTLDRNSSDDCKVKGFVIKKVVVLLF